METTRSKLSWLGLFPAATGVLIMIVYTMIIMRNPPYQFVYLLIVMLMISSIGAYYLTKFKQIRVFGHIGMLVFLLGGGMLFLNNFLNWAFLISQLIPSIVLRITTSVGYLLLGIDALLMKPKFKTTGVAFFVLFSVPILAYVRFQLGIQGWMINFLPSFVEGFGWLLLGISLLLNTARKTCPACNQVVDRRDEYCPHCGSALT